MCWWTPAVPRYVTIINASVLLPLPSGNGYFTHLELTPLMCVHMNRFSRLLCVFFAAANGAGVGKGMAMTGRRRRIAPWWPSSVVCLLWLLYCCGSALATEQAPASAGIEQQTRQGTITLTLRTDRQSMGVVDTLRVILTVVAPPASTVVFSEPGSTLGPFQVLRMLPKKPQGLGPEQQQWQQEYFLTVEQPGTLTLPALEVQVRSASGDVTLHTEPVTLAVTSSLPDNADVQSPRDIAPPVLLGRRGLPPWVWVALAGLGGVSAGAWWLWRYWQRPPSTRGL